jgi:hypothetical protein
VHQNFKSAENHGKTILSAQRAAVALGLGTFFNGFCRIFVFWEIFKIGTYNKIVIKIQLYIFFTIFKTHTFT